MFVEYRIASIQPFDFRAFRNYMGLKDSCVLCEDILIEDIEIWGFYRPNYSTTRSRILHYPDHTYTISIDMFASYEDLQFLPYLIDSFCKFMDGIPLDFPVDKSLYDILDEDYIAFRIGESVAWLKAMLVLNSKYVFAYSLPSVHESYVTLDDLKRYGVTLTSSTPRIYGYIQHMIKKNDVPSVDLDEYMKSQTAYIGMRDETIEIDIPQHESIGVAKSWQLDGSETYESYGKEDVELLLQIAEEVRSGSSYDGAVLNDIGTIYQEGIGVRKNTKQAAYWYDAAYKAGDTLYAPTNLADIYRKGEGYVKQNLSLALRWYTRSEDPYAWYRIGQAYEEGWTSEPNIEKAFEWYNKAAEAGHHLAIKRLKNSIENGVES